MNLSATEKDVAYVIAPYPQICEFFALTENRNSDAAWEGNHFRARVEGTMPGQPQRFYFTLSDGVELGFATGVDHHQTADCGSLCHTMAEADIFGSFRSHTAKL